MRCKPFSPYKNRQYTTWFTCAMSQSRIEMGRLLTAGTLLTYDEVVGIEIGGKSIKQNQCPEQQNDRIRDYGRTNELLVMSCAVATCRTE